MRKWREVRNFASQQFSLTPEPGSKKTQNPAGADSRILQLVLV